MLMWHSLPWRSRNFPDGRLRQCDAMCPPGHLAAGSYDHLDKPGFEHYSRCLTLHAALKDSPWPRHLGHADGVALLPARVTV